jgi:hypothetical protein
MRTYILPLSVGLAALFLSGCQPGGVSGDAEPAGAEPEPFSSRYDTRQALALSAHWEPAPDDGVELGMGWDSREGRVVPNRCVRLSPVHSPGQTSALTLDEVTSSSDVAAALKVSAAASVKTMFASGSASASFARSTRVSAHSTTLLLNATVTNGVLFAGPAEAPAMARSAYPLDGQGGGGAESTQDTGRLTFHPWARALLDRPTEFRAHCGDGYVSAVSSGARLLASFSVTGKTAAERQTVAAKIKGSYGPANFSGGMNGTTDTKESESQVSVRYLQVGGARGAIATSKADLDAKLATLANEAFESPRFQDVRITPYAQMAEVRFDVGWGETDDEYDLIADTYWQLTALESDLQLILEDYGAFDARTGLDREQLGAFADDLLAMRKAIFAALAAPVPAGSDDGVSSPADRLVLFPGAAPLKGAGPTTVLSADSLARARDIGELARQLSSAFPMGNPTLLRLNLPLPNEKAEEVKKALDDARTAFSTMPGGQKLLALMEAELAKPGADRAVLQRAVVDRYIAPVVRRACERDPTERDCLSRAQLEQLADLVPVRPDGS